MGYYPRPTALRLMEGNRGHRPINEAEPQPERRMPKVPAHLDAIAKREWKKWAPMLMRLRVLTEADETALANLCACQSRLIQAEQMIQKHGLTVVGKDGVERKSPWLRISDQAQEQVNRLTQQFGMTPASRTRIVTSGLEGIDTHMGSLGRKMAAGRKEGPA